ncbi:hypothetical protein GPECTOR_22g941 [Gonium pectorale]|uniref:Sugar phosphate transporter domain-containing protein n=1 Tax=Gonium pectorale TaxID=33097 RepID=A0A150GHQ9_GONPE|nr:hypothetical protein GPECTOR_22g941 [Gonium pectorale]|eukprot:KXZ49347.1 hypothetical protein GPECTOR_22g941 [Gonium pectorale]
MAQKGGILGKATELAGTVLLVSFWYIVNIGLMLSNKWLISETGFHSSTVLTLLHMVTSTAASGVMVVAGWVPYKPLTRALAWKVFALAASFTVSVATW